MCLVERFISKCIIIACTSGEQSATLFDLPRKISLTESAIRLRCERSLNTGDVRAIIFATLTAHVMAKTQTAVSPVSNSPAPSDTLIPSPEQILAANEVKAKNDAKAQRQGIIDSLSFGESATVSLGNARWDDVLDAADTLKERLENIGEKTATATARKLAVLNPQAVAIFRFALVSYQLSGRRCNPAQMGELASKLSKLRKVGALGNGEVKFGSIVLPPMMGEL